MYIFTLAQSVQKLLMLWTIEYSHASVNIPFGTDIRQMRMGVILLKKKKKSFSSFL